MSANAFADPDVTDVQVLGHYRLRLTFADGLQGDVDVSDLADLPGDLVAPLRDPAYFRQVRVDPEQGTVVWPNGVDLAAERLYEDASEHPVVEQAQLPLGQVLIDPDSPGKLVVGVTGGLRDDLEARLRALQAEILGKRDVRRAILPSRRERLDVAAGTGSSLHSSFIRFVESERAPLVSWFSEVATLPSEQSSDLIERALTAAQERWDLPAVHNEPVEWVLGSAVQHLRDTVRELPKGPSAKIREVRQPVDADVRVTGALALVASATPVPDVPESMPKWALAEFRPASALDALITNLYSTHYRALVRLAALLARDVTFAETIVKDAFVDLHASGTDQLSEEAQALAQLRASVVRQSRVASESETEHRAFIAAGASREAAAILQRSALISAFLTLPSTQREVLALRFYADLSEAQIAEVVGIRRRAVRTQLANAMRALRPVFEHDS